jgi:hypothetical protein
MDFLHSCFTLLEVDGEIIISVPKMVGPIMLFKNLLQRSLRLGYDKIPFWLLLKASFLYNTDKLESLWQGDHVGFNHIKLEKYLKKQFKIVRRTESVISVFYVIKRV